MATYSGYGIDQKIRNPKLKEVVDAVLDITSGHDHDGTNTKLVVGGAPADGSVTNTKLATDVKVGSVAALTTTANTNAVAAINELDADIGAPASLTTTIKTSAVLAINELDAEIGNVSTLTTTAKTVVGAINELDSEDAAYVSLTGAETLTNKHLTSAHLTTPLIEDGDAGVTITSADQTNAAPTVTIPNIADAADTFVMADTAQTLTAKHLTSAHLTTPLIEDSDTGISITSANQTHAAPTVTIPDIVDAADTFAMVDTAQTLTLKTLTTPVVASMYQDAGKTKLLTVPDTASDTLAAIAATQTLTNKTLTTPVIASIYQDAGKTKLLTVPDTASDTLVALAATQTLTNKTLTAPVLTNPATTVTLGAHDYAGGAVDWTLSAGELLLPVHKPTNANAAVNAIVAVTIRPYLFINATGQALTVKTAAGTGIVIATSKSAFVMSDGVNVIRLTTDA